MGDIANILLGKFTLWGNPTLNCENGWATSCWPHLDLQFRSFFVELDSQRQEILKSNTALTLQHQILNGKCPSHIIPGLAKSKQYTGVHIQTNVLPILCHDRHSPGRNTDLWDTAEHYSIMFIFMCDHPLWWKSIIIIKNKSEPWHLHGIVLDLVYFTPL